MFLKTAIWGRFRPNWRVCCTLRCFACWLCTYWAASPAPPANPAFPVRPLAQTAGHANPLSPLMFSREEKKKPNRVLCFSRSTAPPCGVLLTGDSTGTCRESTHTADQHQDAQKEQVPRSRVLPPCTWIQIVWPWQWTEKLIFLSLLWFRLELGVHPCYHLMFVWAVHILGSHYIYKKCQHVVFYFMVYGFKWRFIR